MEQIVINELPRYLNLKDRNSLCYLNKEFYHQLRAITPSLKDIKRKEVVFKELISVTEDINFNLDIFDYTIPHGFKIVRMRQSEIYRRSFNNEKDEVYYHAVCLPSERLLLLVPKDSKHKYLWVILVLNK